MGVAIGMAFCSTGVVPLGVKPPGVISVRVIPTGVKDGVIPPGLIPVAAMEIKVSVLGVMVLEVPPLMGVSSQRDMRLLVSGVGVSWIKSPPRSVQGVSAQPQP